LSRVRPDSAPDLFARRHPPPTGIHPLSLHDALPIYISGATGRFSAASGQSPLPPGSSPGWNDAGSHGLPAPRYSTQGYFLVEERSEEHTSELQSRENLVCRLLLEKKKEKKTHNLSES